jgi:ATP:ADP antiporter, AAA family
MPLAPQGTEYLSNEKWQKMGTKTLRSQATEFFDDARRRLTEGYFDEEKLRVLWLSSTLFFIVGGYWLLRSLKDPIISVIDGVSPPLLLCLSVCLSL